MIMDIYQRAAMACGLGQVIGYDHDPAEERRDQHSRLVLSV
jgi:hypothetical protein